MASAAKSYAQLQVRPFLHSNPFHKAPVQTLISKLENLDAFELIGL
jgi:hypothetical protein